MANTNKSLSYSGLQYFWGKLKTLLAGKVDNSRVLTDVPENAKFTDTVYTHPETAGNKHIPAGGSAGKILVWSADGTAVWGDDKDTVYTHPTYTPAASGLYKITVDSTGHVSEVSAVEKGDITGLGIPGQDTTYTVATSTSDGLLSKTDKSKLDSFGKESDYAKKSDISSVYKLKGTKATYAELPNNAEVGDVYSVTDKNGMNYVWTGSEWDALGEVFTIDYITNAEIDAIMNAE